MEVRLFVHVYGVEQPAKEVSLMFTFRRVLFSAGVRATPVLHLCIFLLSCLAFYPYAKDFICLCRLVSYAVQRRFFEGNQDVTLTFVELYIYMSIVMVS